jgi:hypothetical protein
VADGKLRQALKVQGFEIYENVESLIGAVEGANTALPIRTRPRLTESSQR